VSKTNEPAHPLIKETDLDAKFLNLWKKAIISTEQRNWDYVVSLVLPIVKAHPGFMDGRALVRRAEAQRAGPPKKGLSLSGGFSLFGGGSKKDPSEAINDLEDGVFQKDPYNPKANETLYDLAMKLHMPDLAAFALETIREGYPENTKNSHRLAQHYMGNEQPEKASSVYQHIQKMDPRDMDAKKGEKDAAARTSILRQGWNETGDFRKAMKSSDEANKMEMLNKQGMTREQMETLLNELYNDYNADNTNIRVVKDIANVLERMDDHESALGYYNWALQLNPGDVAMQRKIEMVQDKIADMSIQRMEAEIDADPAAPDIEDKRAQIADIKRQRSATVIAEAKARVERNPTDKQFQFDLGSAYFYADMYTEAIPHLQQAKSNPHIRNKAMLMLGRCFERKNMNDLAITQLSEVSRELAIMDNTKKEVLAEGNLQQRLRLQGRGEAGGVLVSVIIGAAHPPLFPCRRHPRSKPASHPEGWSMHQPICRGWD
jgi:tetratricopeptide (TPR) repeat protein